MSDLVGLSQPAKKLIEAIASGIGVLYEPTRIRRRASAEAEAQIILAHAEIQKSELARRAAQRVGFQEMSRQANIDAVVDGAFRQLPESSSDTPVPADWISRFFDDCKDVSDIDMQQLWSRLLAGEVARPGTFSSRTLTLLRQMEPDDADRLVRALSLSWQHSTGERFIIRPLSGFNTFYSRFGLYWSNVLALASLGLIEAGRGTVTTLQPGQRFKYGTQSYVARRLIPFWPRSVPVFLFTESAIELLRVVHLRTNDDFYMKSRRFMGLVAGVWLAVDGSPPSDLD
jgi:hypothetical protein